MFSELSDLLSPITIIFLFVVLGGGLAATRDTPFYKREFGGHKAERPSFQPFLVFLMMPFSGYEMQATFKAIKDECIKLGLNPIRVDEITGSGFIIREIASLIAKAQFIICDLTDARPNVYYELGYAHGIGNYGSDILLIAKEGTTLHFDIAPLRVHYYRSTKHLRSIVSHHLESMIRESRDQTSH